MRAPVAPLARVHVLVLAILLMVAAWMAFPAAAEETPTGPPAMASEDEDAMISVLAGGALRVSADVALVDASDGDAIEPVVGSFTVDGLAYAIAGEGQVALVAVSPRTLADGLAGGSAAGLASASDGAEGEGASESAVLEVPEFVEHDGVTCSVVAIGPRAFAGCDADVVTIPAAVESIDELAFRGSAVAAIEVADGNPTYSSYDGMLFDADQTSLLLIPEGKQGAARIPKTASSVPPDALSHCASVTSVEVEAGSAAYYSENGCLYDMTSGMLLWTPAVTGTDTQFENDLAIVSPVRRSETDALTADLTIITRNNAGSAGTCSLLMHSCMRLVTFPRTSLSPFTAELASSNDYATALREGKGYVEDLGAGELYVHRYDSPSYAWGIDENVGLWVKDGPIYNVYLRQDVFVKEEPNGQKTEYVTPNFSALTSLRHGSDAELLSEAGSSYTSGSYALWIDEIDSKNPDIRLAALDSYQRTIAFDATDLETVSSGQKLTFRKTEPIGNAPVVGDADCPEGYEFAGWYSDAGWDSATDSDGNKYAKPRGKQIFKRNGQPTGDWDYLTATGLFDKADSGKVFALIVPKHFSVRFFSRDGTSEYADLSFSTYYGATNHFPVKPANAPSRAEGWFTEKRASEGIYRSYHNFGATMDTRYNNSGGTLRFYLDDFERKTVRIRANGGSFTFPDGETTAAGLDLGYGRAIIDEGGVNLVGRARYSMSNEGCDFLHWSTDTHSSTTGDTRIDVYLEESTASYYYAIWNVPITWDPNGGRWDDAMPGGGEPTGAVTTKHVSRNKASSPTGYGQPVRAGYDFKGWATKGDADASDAKAEVEPTVKATVYAVWEAREYDVLFDGGGIKEPVMLPDSLRVKSGSEMPTIIAKEPIPCEAGKKFKGWYANDEEGEPTIQYYKIKRYLNATGEVELVGVRPFNEGRDTTLYAVFEEKTFTIKYMDFYGEKTFDMTGSGKFADVPNKVAGKPEGVDSQAIGWALKPEQHVAACSFGASDFKVSDGTDGGTIVLYVARSTFPKILIYANGGSFTIPRSPFAKVPTIELGHGKTVFDPEGVTCNDYLDDHGDVGRFRMGNDGCDFLHWSTESPSAKEGEGRIEVEHLEASKHQFYWAIWNVPITWNPNGGRWDDAMPGGGEPTGAVTTKYVSRNKASSPTGYGQPVRAGYDFKGWATKGDADASDAKAEVEPTVKATVYAVWDAALYDITLDWQVDGLVEDHIYLRYGIGKYEDKTCNKEATGVERPSRYGYVFKGFYDNPEGV